jgi:hypothetical protein
MTTIKAAPGTVFEKFRPDPRTHEHRQRHTLITTDAAGSARGKVVTDTGVSRLTVDWNHCPVQGLGHSVVLADSCDRFELDRVQSAVPRTRFFRFNPSRDSARARVCGWD